MAATLLWTSERVDQIRHMLTTEGLTQSAIAQHFDVSTSSIGGVIERHGMIGLSLHKSIPKPEPIAKPQRLAKFWIGNPHAKPGSQLRNLKCEFSPCAVNWNDFKPDCMCHWPINSAPFLFCGRPRLAKPNVGKQSPYCPCHHARAYPEK